MRGDIENVPAMKILSVNVSMGRTVEWNGELVETGIFKEPVVGRVMVRRSGLAGDRQADLRVHGGDHKAVYAYAAEHYDAWRDELQRDLTPGMFGENLTVQGLMEEEMCVGDQVRVGEAVLEAVQPRLPCFKLGIRFGDQGMLKRFLRSGRSGVYFRVVEEGEVRAGDAVTVVSRDPERFSIAALARLIDPALRDAEIVGRALRVRALPPNWVETLRSSLTTGAA